MRESHPKQQALTPSVIDHQFAKELETVSRILDAHPTLAAAVAQDLVATGASAHKGASGMTGDQALRAALLKQMNQWSYEDLAFHLLDSNTFHRFCRIGIGCPTPKRSTLHYNIKLIKPATWNAIHVLLARIARDEKIESGRKTRVDCTPVDSNIHPPTDGALLWDTARVVAREMGRVKLHLTDVVFHNRARPAKMLAYEIFYGKADDTRDANYSKLIGLTIGMLEETHDALPAIRNALPIVDRTTRRILARALAILERTLPLGWQVLDQTHTRVVDGVQVHASEKIVSIFENHTDIIVKDRRETLYGHKICVSAGASSFITDCVILEGNPADSTLVTEMLNRHVEIYGKAPRQVAYDGGFASKDNLKAAKAAGVKDVCFSKRRGMAITDLAKSEWVYRQLKRFRAGVEGCISFLKRAFGLDRCTWKGEPSFHAYVMASVVASNLLVMARHILDR